MNTMQAIYETAWRKACKTYSLKTGGKSLEKELKKSPQTLGELDLSPHQKDFEAFRQKDQARSDRWRERCSIIERLCGVAQPASWRVPFLRAIFSTMAHVMKAASELSLQYDAIETLLFTTVTIVNDVSIIELETISPEHQVDFEERLAEVFAVAIEVTAYVMGNVVLSRKKDYWKCLLKGQDPMFKSLKEKIELRMSTAQSLRSTDSANVAGMARLDAELPGSTMEDVGFVDLFSQVKSARVSETGSWLHQEPHFQAWMGKSTPVLWIHGPPGFGKTFLAASIVCILEDHRRENAIERTTLVGYAFFSRTRLPDLANSTYQGLLFIVKHLCRKDSKYKQHVKGMGYPKTASEMWQKLFVDYFRGPDRTLFLVLDGVDEIGGSDGSAAKELLNLLLDLRTDGLEQRPSISIVLLGRSEMTDHVVRVGRKCSMVSIRIKADNTVTTLDRYVDDGLKGLRRSRILGEEIKATIRIKGRGMFLWVKLLFSMLRQYGDGRGDSSIRNCLSKVPEGVDAMIEEVMNVSHLRLPPEQYEEMVLVMTWLSASQQPLTVRQVNSMVSYIRSEEMDVENRLRYDYSTLLTILRDDLMSTDALDQSELEHARIPDATYVVFSHASIREYMCRMVLDSNQDGMDTATLRRQPATALTTVLRVCLESLCASRSNLEPSITESLSSHAIDNWVYLLQKTTESACAVGTTERIQMVGLLVHALTDETAIRHWCFATPSTFFTLEKCNIIGSWLAMWTDSGLEDLAGPTRETISSWIERPKRAFLVVSEVFLDDAARNLTYPPFAAFDAVDIIRSYSDYVGNPIINEVWYTNCGNAYAKAGSLQEAKAQFEAALEVGPMFSEARSGLAMVFRRMGLIPKAILEEEENIKALASREVTDALATEARARSFERIASMHISLNNAGDAVKYFEQAMDTKVISIEAASTFFRLVNPSAGPTRWGMMITLLRNWENVSAAKFPSRLIEFLSLTSRPNDERDSIFHIVVTAAKETDALMWLERAYGMAMKHARTHLDLLGLQICVVHLRKIADQSLHSVTDYIESVMEVSENDRERRFLELQALKSMIIQEYCQIQVQKALDPTSTPDRVDKCLQRVQTVCSDDTWGSDIQEKICYMERSALYLAIILLNCGRGKEAAKSLHPFIVEAKYLLGDTTHLNYCYGLQGLAEIYKALGKKKEAMAFFVASHTYSMWVCKHCSEHCPREKEVSMCEHCFRCFCSRCVTQIRLNPMSYGCCVSGHKLWSTFAKKRHPKGRTWWKRRYMFGKQAVELMIEDHARD